MPKVKFKRFQSNLMFTKGNMVGGGAKLGCLGVDIYTLCRIDR